MQHRALGKRKTIVIIAEGAHDRHLQPIKASKVKDLLSKDLGLDTRITTLGHVQRGGNACAYDRMLSTLQGVEAVNAVLESTPETPSPMISIIENKIVRKPLVEAVAATHKVAKLIEDKNFEDAIIMRDAEFAEYMQAFDIMTATDKKDMLLPENEVSRHFVKTPNSTC